MFDYRPGPSLRCAVAIKTMVILPTQRYYRSCPWPSFALVRCSFGVEIQARALAILRQLSLDRSNARLIATTRWGGNPFARNSRGSLRTRRRSNSLRDWNVRLTKNPTGLQPPLPSDQEAVGSHDDRMEQANQF
jgi:hypothetical protein